MNALTKKARELKEEVSFTDFLSRLGYQPKRVRGNELMYVSMVRDSDTDPSFSVNEKLGAWYDHGMGKGGNIFDFARLYWPGLDFAELVDKVEQVSNYTALESGKKREPRPRIREAVKIPNYKIEQIKPFGTSEGLNSYIRSRGLFELAAANLKEVHYYVEDEKKNRKTYFALGWQNEMGGWSIRNKYFKGCLGKQGVTFIANDPKHLVVFEGYLNYLSWRKDNPASRASVLVLNSLSLVSTALEKARHFPAIDVFFDRDKSGFSALGKWLETLPYSTDRSPVYKGYNDYNAKTIANMKEERRKLGR